MNSKRSFFVLLLVMLITSVFFVPMTAAQNAESPNDSLTVSESFLNSIIQEGMQDSNADLYFDMQPGQIVATLSGTNQRGNPYTVSLTLVPTVVNGRVDWAVTKLRLNDLSIDTSRAGQLGGGATDTLGGFFAGQAGGSAEVVSFVVTDTSTTMSWVRQNPDAPVTTIVDHLISLSYTEAKLNALDWVANPTGENVESIVVDLQPGQGVLTTTFAPAGQPPFDVALTLVPTVVNGRVQWQVSAQTLGGTMDGTGSEIGSSFASQWRALFSNAYTTSQMVNAVFTEDSVTFTWDYLLEPAEAGSLGQEEVSFSLTESFINEQFNNSLPPTLTGVRVDLQPGRVLVMATSVTENGDPLAVSFTLVPELVNGTLEWTITSMTINGEPVADVSSIQANDEVVTALTSSVTDGQRQSQVTSLEITDDVIEWTVRYR